MRFSTLFGAVTSPGFIGLARTEEWFALYTNGVPYVARGSAFRPIIGEVYRVGVELLAELDAHEGHPHWYRREVGAVVLTDGHFRRKPITHRRNR